MKIKKAFINCDFRIMFFCLFIHSIFLWLSNAELLATTVRCVNSQLGYWIYQSFLLFVFLAYILSLFVYSFVLKKISGRFKKYLVIFSLLFPLFFCIRSGTFSSKYMKIQNLSGMWYGINIYKYLIIWIVLVFSISIIFVFIKFLKKRSKKNG